MFVWTIGDTISLALFAMVLIVVVSCFAATAWRQWRCKHDGGVGETRACDAICRSCGKNLGFISAWREKHGGRHG